MEVALDTTEELHQARRYQIGKRIGRGGMGSVIEAKDRNRHLLVRVHGGWRYNARDWLDTAVNQQQPDTD